MGKAGAGKDTIQKGLSNIELFQVRVQLSNQLYIIVL